MSDHRQTVLLVEDNPGDARLIQELLGDLSGNVFHLEIADRLATALLRLNAGGIDAVLLDLTLPDSEGGETFRKTRAQAPAVPIIVLTGLGDEVLALKMVQEGAQDYVAKFGLQGGVLRRAIRYAIERNKSEQQMRNFNEELEVRVWERTAELKAANEELEEFSASVSHDLRGPLHLISGCSELLEATLGPNLNAEVTDHLRRIRTGVQEMSGIIEDLLRLSRLGRQHLMMQNTNLDEILLPILGHFQSSAQGRKIEWNIDSLPRVKCDQGLIKQVLSNLISNAVKYTRLREVAVIEIGQTTFDGQNVIFVRDNGAGFDMNHMDRLFHAFQRLHRPEEFEGTGVGLATVRRIVQRHGGRIWAEGKVDKGATFYFTLGHARLDSEPAKPGTPS